MLIKYIFFVSSPVLTCFGLGSTARMSVSSSESILCLFLRVEGSAFSGFDFFSDVLSSSISLLKNLITC